MMSSSRATWSFVPFTSYVTAPSERSSYPVVPDGTNAISRRPADVTRFHSSARESADAVKSNASPSGTLSVYTRASSSWSADARCSRFSSSRAGVMSASAVKRGNPCMRAPSAPIRTYRTWFAARTAMRRSGSSALISLARSDTSRTRDEPAHVRHLAQTLDRGQAEDSRAVLEHVRVNDGLQPQRSLELEARGGKQSIERLHARDSLPTLDARDDRLRGVRSRGEFALGDAGLGAGLDEQARRIFRRLRGMLVGHAG